MKIFKRITVYIIIGLIVTLPLLYYVNDKVSYNSTAVISPEITTINSKDKKLSIPEDSTFIDVIEDSKYISYISDGDIIIKKLSDNTVLKKIDEIDPICFVTTPEKIHKVLYMVQGEKNFEFKTYSIKDKESVVEAKIPRKAKSKIKSIYFSTLTNDIYVTISNDKYYDIYKVDIMKKVTLEYSWKLIENGDMLKNEPKNGESPYIYENDQEAIYINNKLFKYNKTQNKGFKLLGVDREDNIFILNKNAKLILKVKNNKVVDEIPIDDINYNKILLNNGQIHLVYSDSIYDVNNNSSFKKRDDEVIEVAGELIIYKNSNTEISIEKIK